MQGFLKGCARGALGLGAVALLLAGVPAHAGEKSGSINAPAAAPRASQPLTLAQSTAQQEEAAQLEKRRQEEQRKQMQEKSSWKRANRRPRRTMGKPEAAMPEAAPAPEATPPAPGSKRFGAGVIRHGDPGDSGEVE